MRSAQLQLAREKAILEEQERQILNDLSGSITEMRRAYLLANTNRSRSLAALDQLKALEAVLVDPDRKELIRLLDLLLDAQRRRADAESNYHRSLAEYAVAVKNVSEDAASREALVQASGSEQAPCLVIGGETIQESADIVTRLLEATAPV